MSEERLRERLNRLGAEGVDRQPSCPDTERLAAYADGDLSDDERLVLEEHLADCGHCLGQVRFLVRSADLGPAPEVPEHLLDAVREQTKPVWRRPPAWFAAAAGLVLVVLTVRIGVIDTTSPDGDAGTEITAPADEPRSVRNHVLGSEVPTVTSPLDGQRVGRGALTIAWQPVAEAFDYSVQLMDAEGNLIWEDRTGAQSTTVPQTVTLEPDGSYFVWVAAHMRSGLRAKSPAVAFEVTND